MKVHQRKLSAANHGLCDVVFVDGDHEGYSSYYDILNYKPTSDKDTIVFSDDTFDDTFYYTNDCSKSWKRALSERIIMIPKNFEPSCITMGRAADFVVPIGHCSVRYAAQ